MMFFSVIIKFSNTISDHELSGLSQASSFACQRFYEQSEDSDFIFIDKIRDSRIRCIAMTSNESLKKNSVADPVRAFLRMLSIEPQTIKINEITCYAAIRKLRSAIYRGYVIDGDAVLDDLAIRWVEKSSMVEKLIPPQSNKRAILKKAALLFDNRSFIEEIERIYQQSMTVLCCGHSVHYMIEMDCQDLHLQAAKLLLSALYANQRSRSKRYTIKVFASVEPISESYLQKMFETCAGGTCLIDYVTGDRGHEDPGSPDEVDIDMLCSAINQFKHSVLIIICVSPIQKVLREQIMRRVPSFILIQNAKEAESGVPKSN